MPLVRINVDGATPVSALGHLQTVIGRVLGDVPDTAPVVVMIHGYKHSPFEPAHDPHAHILSLAPRRKGRSLSWPKHLGFGRGARSEGLAIAFGWNARGSIWQAYRAAGQAGIALAELIRALHAVRPGPTDIIAHSLGARAALAATGRLPEGALGRGILLSGAEFSCRAATAGTSIPGASPRC